MKEELQIAIKKVYKKILFKYYILEPLIGTLFIFISGTIIDLKEGMFPSVVLLFGLVGMLTFLASSCLYIFKYIKMKKNVVIMLPTAFDDLNEEQIRELYEHYIKMKKHHLYGDIIFLDYFIAVTGDNTMVIFYKNIYEIKWESLCKGITLITFFHYTSDPIDIRIGISGNIDYFKRMLHIKENCKMLGIKFTGDD